MIFRRKSIFSPEKTWLSRILIIMQQWKGVPWYSMTFLGLHELRKSSNKLDYGIRAPVTHCWGLMASRAGTDLSTCPDHSLFNIARGFHSSVSHLPFHSLLLPTFPCPRNSSHFVFLRDPLTFIEVAKEI